MSLVLHSSHHIPMKFKMFSMHLFYTVFYISLHTDLEFKFLHTFSQVVRSTY